MLQYCKRYLWERNSRTFDCVLISYFVNGNSFAFFLQKSKIFKRFFLHALHFCVMRNNIYSLHNHTFIILLPVVTYFFYQLYYIFICFYKNTKMSFFLSSWFLSLLTKEKAWASTEGSSLTLLSPPRGSSRLVYLSHCDVRLPLPPGRSLIATCCGAMTVPNAHSSVTPSGSNPGKLDSLCQIIHLCAFFFVMPIFEI